MLNYDGSAPRRMGGSGLVTLLAVSLLAACATMAPPDDQPPTQAKSVGYGDLELSPNHYRVSFSSGIARTRVM